MGKVAAEGRLSGGEDGVQPGDDERRAAPRREQEGRADPVAGACTALPSRTPLSFAQNQHPGRQGCGQAIREGRGRGCDQGRCPHWGCVSP